MRLSTSVMTLLLAACGASPPADTGIGQQKLLGLCVGLVQPACCYDSDCDDHNDCTIDTCEGEILGLVAGTCAHTPRSDAKCCNTASECTTIPGCGTPICTNTGNPWKDCVVSAGGSSLCCNAVGDCPTKTCKATTSCTANKCVYTATPAAPGCCANAGDCTTANACQVAACTDNTCVVSTAVASGCCSSVPDCAANACQIAHCQTNQCSFTAKIDAGCCEIPDDCQPNECQVASCDANRCALTAKNDPGCCETSADCAPVGPCRTVPCVANRCQPSPRCAPGHDPPEEDAATAPVDAGVPLEEIWLTRGGGGCSTAGDLGPGAVPALLLFAVLLSFALRRSVRR